MSLVDNTPRLEMHGTSRSMHAVAFDRDLDFRELLIDDSRNRVGGQEIHGCDGQCFLGYEAGVRHDEYFALWQGV
jgi:hypothetical protein